MSSSEINTANSTQLTPDINREISPETDPADVLIVGGGAAGLSAALTLARAQRSVVVLDDGRSRDVAAAGAHGFLSRDDMTSPLAIGAQKAESYGARIVAARATEAHINARNGGGGFVVKTDEGVTHRALRLLVTTGLTYELPQIPGVRERWGRDVLHCPYCDGWEIRGQHLGVIGSGPGAFHAVLLFGQWSDRITLFLHNGPEPSDEQWEQLAALGVRVVDGEIADLAIDNDRLQGVRLRSGPVFGLDAVVVAPRFLANTEVVSGLGLTAADHPSGIGTHIQADLGGATGVPGVWVAGNITDPTAGAVQAAASGVTAAAGINMDLITYDNRAALQRYRSRAQAPRTRLQTADSERSAPSSTSEVFSPAAEAQLCDQVLGDRRHGLHPVGLERDAVTRD